MSISVKLLLTDDARSFLYADPTPNALQVFLPEHGILDDAGNTPIPANAATAGLAPSAASLLMKDQPESGDVIMHDADEDAEGEQGGMWISADPKPGCLVCNIGESKSHTQLSVSNTHILLSIVWEIWTNGLYKSTLHRVVHRGSNYRWVQSLTVLHLVCLITFLQCFVSIEYIYGELN